MVFAPLSASTQLGKVSKHLKAHENRGKVNLDHEFLDVLSFYCGFEALADCFRLLLGEVG
jgi:hypothetical protein